LGDTDERRTGGGAGSETASGEELGKFEYRISKFEGKPNESILNECYGPAGAGPYPRLGGPFLGSVAPFFGFRDSDFGFSGFTEVDNAKPRIKLWLNKQLG
jgi:hypothetical protein